jgi:hypothetical protein
LSAPATNVLGRDPLELESILRRLASRLARQENLIPLSLKCLSRFTIEEAMKGAKKVCVCVCVLRTHSCHTDNAVPRTVQFTCFSRYGLDDRGIWFDPQRGLGSFCSPKRPVWVLGPP